MDKIRYQNQYKGSSSFNLEIRTEHKILKIKQNSTFLVCIDSVKNKHNNEKCRKNITCGIQITSRGLCQSPSIWLCPHQGVLPLKWDIAIF